MRGSGGRSHLHDLNVIPGLTRHPCGSVRNRRGIHEQHTVARIRRRSQRVNPTAVNEWLLKHIRDVALRAGRSFPVGHSPRPQFAPLPWRLLGAASYQQYTILASPEIRCGYELPNGLYNGLSLDWNGRRW